MIKNFGKNLREKRIEKGWSLKKLADKANIHFTTINYYELNKREPTLLIALKLANALDCSVYELCGMTDKEEAEAKLKEMG